MILKARAPPRIGPRGKKFVALVHIYAELRLPFDSALDAAEADLLREQNEGRERGRTAVKYGR
jgi:hypothetical protein